MSAMLKRPAAASNAEPAAKRAYSRPDPVTAKCKVVAAAISKTRDVPKSVVAMLGDLTETLGVAKDERHRHQESFVEMVGEILDGMTKTLEGQIAEEQGKIDGAAEEKPRREAKRQEAVEALAALQTKAVERHAEFQECKAALEAAEAAVAEASAALLSAEQAVQDLEPEVAAAQLERELKQEKLASFRAGAIAAYAELRDRALLDADMAQTAAPDAPPKEGGPPPSMAEEVATEQLGLTQCAEAAVVAASVEAV